MSNCQLPSRCREGSYFLHEFPWIQKWIQFVLSHSSFIIRLKCHLRGQKDRNYLMHRFIMWNTSVVNKNELLFFTKSKYTQAKVKLVDTAKIKVFTFVCVGNVLCDACMCVTTSKFLEFATDGNGSYCGSARYSR